MVRYKEGDDEAFRFAIDIHYALLKAGWYIQNDPFPIAVEPSLDVMGINTPRVRTGVTALVPSAEIWQSTVKTLIETLDTSDAPLRLTRSAPPDDTRLVIIVGSKPAFSSKIDPNKFQISD